MLEEDAKEAEEAEKTVQLRSAPTLLKMIMQHSTVEKRQKAYLR